jgi:hypothetical protein
MKRYEIRVVIEEGSDEFWEGIVGDGVRDVVDPVQDAVLSVFPEAQVYLTKFSDTSYAGGCD